MEICLQYWVRVSFPIGFRAKSHFKSTESAGRRSNFLRSPSRVPHVLYTDQLPGGITRFTSTTTKKHILGEIG